MRRIRTATGVLRFRLFTAAGLLVAALVAGCTSAPTQESGSPSSDLPLDPGATLTVSPVDYNGASVVIASFGEDLRTADHRVLLQRQGDAVWEEVDSAAMPESGKVEFLAHASPSDTYRAVAVATDDAQATPAVTASDEWKLTLESEFTSDSLEEPWGYRMTGSYTSSGRRCSAPVEANVEFDHKEATVSMVMSKASEEVASRVSAAAKDKQHSAGEDVVGCPNGVFDNAMISTEGQFTVQQGTVAARVKFPRDQGAHGGVWLQSGADQEIDIVEGYGHGWGLTNMAHIKGEGLPADGSDAYVASEAAADPAWWEQWHTVSVEWDLTRMVFRIDGVKTHEFTVETSNAEYFIVLSNLSSDWETPRLTAPGVRKGSGVDAKDVVKAELPFAIVVDSVRVWEPA